MSSEMGNILDERPLIVPVGDPFELVNRLGFYPLS